METASVRAVSQLGNLALRDMIVSFAGYQLWLIPRAGYPSRYGHIS